MIGRRFRATSFFFARTARSRARSVGVLRRRAVMDRSMMRSRARSPTGRASGDRAPATRKVSVKRAGWAARVARPRAMKRVRAAPVRRRRGRAGGVGLGAGGSTGHSRSTSGVCRSLVPLVVTSRAASGRAPRPG